MHTYVNVALTDNNDVKMLNIFLPLFGSIHVALVPSNTERNNQA